mgnify:CR=1 FL=1
MPVIILSGAIASGKSTLAKILESKGFFHLSTRAYIRAHIEKSNPSREELQAEGERLDREEPKWLTRQVGWSSSIHRGVVVDAVRDVRQVDAIRREMNFKGVFHIHLTANGEELRARYNRRSESTEYDKAKEHHLEANIEALASDCDLLIDTSKCSADETALRVGFACGIISHAADIPYVDVLVGGQYGSEGKGHVVAHIAPEYDFLVRVGGPNAGHTVLWEGKKYSFYHLPSGTLHNQGAKILLGAGAVINPEILFKEIDKAGVTADRLAIHPNANIITQEDIADEAALIQKVGSTGQGVGLATARKIMYRGERKMAKDYGPFAPYIRDVDDLLERARDKGYKVLLEGTQGTGLSLHHGPYPYVTSRDTTAGGTLAEAGIGIRYVRRIVMVVRTNPIRVASPEGGTSGPMGREISWEDVAERAGETGDVLRERERTTTTKRLRRVSEFDWKLLSRAVALNTPTDIALTFSDYISPENQKARRFEQLTPETHDLIREIERIASCPVSMITTRFHERSIIDRRSWK